MGHDNAMQKKKAEMQKCERAYCAWETAAWEVLLEVKGGGRKVKEKSKKKNYF